MAMASVSNSAAAAKDDDASAWKTIKQRLEMLVKRVDAGGGNNESKSLRREETRYRVEWCVCRPPVTRGVTVKRPIPIASDPPR